MNILIILLVIIINFILQSTIIPYLGILGVVPNTSIIIIVIISLLKGKRTGSITGLLMGLLQDLIFSPIIGVNGFIYFFTGYFVGMLESKLSKDSFLIPFIITIVATIGYHLFYALFMFFLGHNINLIVLFEETVIFEVVYNSLVSILFYKWFSNMFKVPSLKFGKK